MALRLPREPRTDDELWWVIKAMFGIELPRTAVCEGHVSPFDAVAHAYFGKEPNFAVWYASRGSGKSLALAVLGLTKAFVRDVDVTILGGSMTQSLNVREHMRKLMSHKNSPSYAVDKDQATLIQMSTGKSIKPLPASQTTVRGPHPPLQLLDECLPGAALIDTPDGPRRIDVLSRGDTVTAWRLEGVVTCTVMAARCTGRRATIVVVLANGAELVCTGNHPVMTSDGWTRADALRIGQGVLVVPAAVDRARREPRPSSGLLRRALSPFGGLWRLDPGLRSSSASSSRRGPRWLLARPAKRRRERPAQTGRSGARRLPSGLRSYGRDALLVEVTGVRPGPETAVYNLTVAQEHSYLAGGVVVHNCDEMDKPIYDASLGQAMEQLNAHGQVIEEYIVASSTWQNPEGTFTQIIEDARERGLPIFTWCWRELLQPHGWMSQRFIDAKRKTVSAQMWHTEYELNEPNAGSRAMDLDKVEKYFVDYGTPLRQVHRGNGDHDVYVWEDPTNGLYAVGADWAKEHDKTVIAVVRYDVMPHRLVKLTRINRRPWDVMIGLFNADVAAYQAIAEHDGTGIGNVVDDFVDYSDSTNKFVMVGRARTQMLLDYITCFEHHHYELPKIPANLDYPGVAVDPLYRAHRSTTVADVYAPGKWNSHLPDDMAAMALAHRAISGAAVPSDKDGLVRKDGFVRDVDKPFHVKPDGGNTVISGGVEIVDERYGVDPEGLDVGSDGSRDPWAAMSV